MYKKGLIDITTPKCASYDHNFGICDNEGEPGHVHYTLDDSRDDLNNIKPPCVFLPHSCDEWIVGGIKEVENMIEDLVEVLKKLKASS